MAKTVSITEAREHLSELITEIENGTEEIIISRRGTPVARLIQSNHQSESNPWPSQEEMNALLEGADTLEEIKARLKKAGFRQSKFASRSSRKSKCARGGITASARRPIKSNSCAPGNSWKNGDVPLAVRHLAFG